MIEIFNRDEAFFFKKIFFFAKKKSALVSRLARGRISRSFGRKRKRP